MALPLGETGRAAGVGAAVGSGRVRISVIAVAGGASGGRPPALGRALEMTRDDESSACSAWTGAGVSIGAGAAAAGAVTSLVTGVGAGVSAGVGATTAGAAAAAGTSTGAGAAAGGAGAVGAAT